MWKVMTVAVLLATLAKVCPAGNWIADGDYLNVGDVAGPDWAINPSLMTVNGTPYVIWEEEMVRGNTPSQVIVKRLSNGAWVQVGEHLNVDPLRAAVFPSITQVNNVPYATWSESNGTKTQIYVKHLENAVWVQDGTSLNQNTNQDATTPSCTGINGLVYVAWSESVGANHCIYVKHRQNGDWVQDGGALNGDPNQDATTPSVAERNGNPCVAWVENGQVLVKAWNGTAWNPLPGSMPNGFYPVMTSRQGSPWLAYQENWVANSQIQVRQDNGTSWEALGNTLNLVAGSVVFEPALAFCGATPYAAWIEDLKVNVSHFNGNAWESDGINIDQTTWSDASPSMAFAGSILYATWVRQGPGSLIVVKHCQTNSIPDPSPTPTPSPIVTATLTPTNTPTPSGNINIMDKYCLAFPNPAKNQMNFVVVTQPGEKVEILIYNLAGEPVAKLQENANANQSTLQWNCNLVAAGIYIVKIKRQEIEVAKLKVAVKR